MEVKEDLDCHGKTKSEVLRELFKDFSVSSLEHHLSNILGDQNHLDLIEGAHRRRLCTMTELELLHLANHWISEEGDLNVVTKLGIEDVTATVSTLTSFL